MFPLIHALYKQKCIIRERSLEDDNKHKRLQLPLNLMVIAIKDINFTS